LHLDIPKIDFKKKKNKTGELGPFKEFSRSIKASLMIYRILA
jgi:hypothetical protein